MTNPFFDQLINQAQANASDLAKKIRDMRPGDLKSSGKPVLSDLEILCQEMFKSPPPENTQDVPLDMAHDLMMLALKHKSNPWFLALCQTHTRHLDGRQGAMVVDALSKSKSHHRSKFDERSLMFFKNLNPEFLPIAILKHLDVGSKTFAENDFWAKPLVQHNQNRIQGFIDAITQMDFHLNLKTTDDKIQMGLKVFPHLSLDQKMFWIKNLTKHLVRQKDQIKDIEKKSSKKIITDQTIDQLHDAIITLGQDMQKEPGGPHELHQSIDRVQIHLVDTCMLVAHAIILTDLLGSKSLPHLLNKLHNPLLVPTSVWPRAQNGVGMPALQHFGPTLLQFFSPRASSLMPGGEKRAIAKNIIVKSSPAWFLCAIANMITPAPKTLQAPGKNTETPVVPNLDTHPFWSSLALDQLQQMLVPENQGVVALNLKPTITNTIKILITEKSKQDLLGQLDKRGDLASLRPSAKPSKM